MAVKSVFGRSNAAVFALLGLAFATCLALVVARIAYSHTSSLQFLTWDLFLA